MLAQIVIRDKTYKHTQISPTTVWTVIHNLNKTPCIVITDSSGAEVEGHIVHDSNMQATITFSAAFAGEADCN